MRGETDPHQSTRLLGQRADGAPMYTYAPVPGRPSVATLWVGPGCAEWPPAPGHAHSHDFLMLVFFERGGGALQVGSRAWRIKTGDVYVVAPGEVLGVHDGRGLATAAAWSAYFPPEAIDHTLAASFLAWRAHPLLVPFVHGSGGAQRLRVPPAERAAWAARFRALDGELRRSQDGYQAATLAHLTLLLVDVARLACGGTGVRGLRMEPLLAEVFAVIEQRYRERLSLHDVAAAVSLTPGYLTTVVRRHTGRTVQAWIAERRMAEARRLLVETDLAVDEIAQRVGYGDVRYFVRAFGRMHQATPRSWRHAGRV